MASVIAGGDAAAAAPAAAVAAAAAAIAAAASARSAETTRAASSGTVGAAMEAVLSGCPAFAVSQEWSDEPDFELATEVIELVARNVLEHGLGEGELLNVNLPAKAAEDPAEVALAIVCRYSASSSEALAAAFSRSAAGGANREVYTGARTDGRTNERVRRETMP